MQSTFHKHQQTIWELILQQVHLHVGEKGPLQTPRRRHLSEAHTCRVGTCSVSSGCRLPCIKVRAVALLYKSLLDCEAGGARQCRALRAWAVILGVCTYLPMFVEAQQAPVEELSINIHHIDNKRTTIHNDGRSTDPEAGGGGKICLRRRLAQASAGAKAAHKSRLRPQPAAGGVDVRIHVALRVCQYPSCKNCRVSLVSWTMALPTHSWQFPLLPALVVAGAVARLLYIGWRRWPARCGGGFQSPPVADSHFKSLVVLGSGGHTGEMCSLLGNMALPHGALTFITAESDTSSAARLMASTVRGSWTASAATWHPSLPCRRRGARACQRDTPKFNGKPFQELAKSGKVGRHRFSVP